MKIAPGESRTMRRTGRTEPVILFLVAGQMFAISAGSILEIRSTDSLSSSASEIHQARLPKVRHRLRRGGKSLYVVNASEHFGLPHSRPTLVLVLRGCRVAVLVDRIDRMETMSVLRSLPRPFRGPERAWYRGITLMGEEVVPVVSPSGFLAEGELSFLDDISRSADSVQAEPAPAAGMRAEPGNGGASE
jgi:chemotaxis signal transduction protein